MNQPDPIDVLNRLLQVLYRSLIVYVAEIVPWSVRSQEKGQAIKVIADDQVRMSRRVADVIREQRGRVDTGGYPAEFTSLHDLRLNYLLQMAIERQAHDVAAIEQCVAQLQRAPFLRPIAEEALGHARGHLENLEEMMNDE